MPDRFTWNLFDTVKELRKRGITKEHIEELLKTATDPKKWQWLKDASVYL